MSRTVTRGCDLPGPTDQLVALQGQNNVRLARVLASKNPGDFALYKHKLEEYLRDHFTPQEFADFMHDAMKLTLTKRLNSTHRNSTRQMLQLSMMMAMADALAHHEMVAFKDSCDEAGVLPSPLCMKRARSCLDFFGTSGRAPVTMKKYETILNKICDTIGEDTDYDVPIPDPSTVLEYHTADDVVTAVCKHYTLDSSRASILRQLVTIYDMQGLYVQKDAFVVESQRRFPSFSKYAGPDPNARAMSAGQLEKVKELSAHLARLATEAVDHHQGQMTLTTWQTIMDYLLVASLYAAPNERYESPRLDFAKASFCDADPVYVKVVEEVLGDGREFLGPVYTVTIHYKQMNKTGASLTVNLSTMAPTLATFLVKYRAMLRRNNACRYLLFCSPRYQKKLYAPISTPYYSTLLARTFKKHEPFLGFDMKAVCGAGCNGARHSVKRIKRGAPITTEEREDIAQQGHSVTTDNEY